MQEFKVFYKNEQVGKAEITVEGLFTVLRSTCTYFSHVMRLYAFTDDDFFPVGILTPDGDCLKILKKYTKNDLHNTPVNKCTHFELYNAGDVPERPVKQAVKSDDGPEKPAEELIIKPEISVAERLETEPEAKPANESETAPEAKLANESETAPEVRPVGSLDTEPETKLAGNIEIEPEAEPAEKSETEPEVRPVGNLDTESEVKTAVNLEIGPEVKPLEKCETTYESEKEMILETEQVLEKTEQVVSAPGVISEGAVEQVQTTDLPPECDAETPAPEKKVEAAQEIKIDRQQQARTSIWQPIDDPSSLFTDPELKETAAVIKDGMIANDGNSTLLAIPISSESPFPLMPVFRYGWSAMVDGKCCIVFRIRDGYLI